MLNLQYCLENQIEVEADSSLALSLQLLGWGSYNNIDGDKQYLSQFFIQKPLCNICGPPSQKKKKKKTSSDFQKRA